MSLIRGKNTKPELFVRRWLCENGHRHYRLHSKLPGRPDITFAKRKIAIFVDGCFWHGCTKCKRKPVKTNRKFWNNKIETNMKRDKRTRRELRKMGWTVVKLWEHELKKSLGKTFDKLELALATDHITSNTAPRSSAGSSARRRPTRS